MSNVIVQDAGLKVIVEDDAARVIKVAAAGPQGPSGVGANLTAAEVQFDPTGTDLTSDNVQNVIVEVNDVPDVVLLFNNALI